MTNQAIAIVEKQLYHYNRRELEAFVQVYSEDVEVYILGEKEPYLVGRDDMRVRYEERFKSEGLHAKVTNRMQKGHVVIDYEEVSGIKDSETVIAIAIYEIEGDYIKKVHFVR